MIHLYSQGNTIRRVTFVSDLHLMSGRSNAEQHRLAIERCIEESDVCVWGGDLFDFRWSRLASEADAVRASLAWLDDWYEQFPTKQFVFLNGNHDAHEAFRSSLKAWSLTRDRFLAGLECLRFGNTLWLHGDVIEGDGSADAFANYRGKWTDRPVAGNLASGIYDLAVNARVHKAAAFAVHRRRGTCLRLARWLHRQPKEQTEGIERVVFGHTHRRIDGYRVGNFQFYNGGAAIRHVPFNPITTEFSSE